MKTKSIENLIAATLCIAASITFGLMDYPLSCAVTMIVALVLIIRND